MINKIEIERLSLVTSKSFDEVLASIEAAVAHPDMAEFFPSIQRTASVREMEDTINRAIGQAGLMLFAKFDHGGIIYKGAGNDGRRVMRLLIGNPLIMAGMARNLPDAGSYAPVTVLIDERSDGVHLSYDRMSSFLAPYGSSEALRIASELDAKIEMLLRRAIA
jgi:uncharacterized protein (DUF302 family)